MRKAVYTIDVEPELHTLTHSARNRRLLVVAGVVGAIAALATSLWWYQTDHARPELSSGTAITAKDIALMIGQFSAAPISVLNKDSVFSPLTLQVSGKELYVIDKVFGKEGSQTYILIEQKDTPVSNIYKKSTTGDIHAVTSSDTVKFMLSTDISTGRFLYLATSTKTEKDLFKHQDNDITMYDPLTQKEQVLAQGKNPHLLNGGDAFIYEKNGKIRIHSISHTSDTELLSLAHLGPYAINKEGTLLSIFNPITRAVDTYTIIGNSSLSYLSSKKVTTYPTIISYFKGKTYVLSGGELSNKPHPISLEEVDTGKKTSITSNIPGWPQRAYDYIP